MQRRTIVWLTVVTAVVAAVAVAGFTLRSPGSERFPVADLNSTGPVTREANVTLYSQQSGVLFDVASATINGSAVPTLRSIAADIMKSHPTGAIRVEGYTDDAGPEDYNYDLSKRRGQSVAAWLADNSTIDQKRITVYPYGETNPTQPNDTDAHRQANRRVIIAVGK